MADAFLQAVHLHVVRRGDQDVVLAKFSTNGCHLTIHKLGALIGLAIKLIHQCSDAFYLLVAGGAVTAVVHRLEEQALRLP